MPSFIPPAPPPPEASALSPSSELLHAVRSQLSKVSGGLASDDYLRAWWDWWVRLAMRPDQQLALATSAMAKAAESWQFIQQQLSGAPAAEAPSDKRFAGAAWQQWPFNLYAHAYGQIADWSARGAGACQWHRPGNQQRLQFLLRQALAAANPAHYLLTNPELLELTRAEAGANLLRGAQYWPRMRCG